MPGANMVPEKIRPVKLLYEVRKSVSEILGKPFSEHIDHQIFRPDQKVLAMWAAECAERVLPYFEDKYPEDIRPRNALAVLREWIRTGRFSMSIIRQAALGAHSAARGKKEDAAFAAHAAGQAVSTAHVVTHALGASLYGIRAAAAHSGNENDGLKERDWQLERLGECVISKRANPKLENASEGNKKMERNQTRKAIAQYGQRAEDTDGERDVLERIAAMPNPDREIGERLHAIIKASAPSLSPKLWYTMPAYAKEGKVICFFRESHTRRPATGRAPSVGAMRYVTFGFNEWANLDEGAMWPIAFAVTELTSAVEARISALVKKAVS